MLKELQIHGFPLLQNSRFSFAQGLNVISGETGSGKSLLIKALGLLLGDEVSFQGEGFVLGLFESSSQIDDFLQQRGLLVEKGTLLMKTLWGSRRTYFINQQTVLRNDMRDLGLLLFERHGQHENHSLFDSLQHRRYLDSYASEDFRKRRESFSLFYKEFIATQKKYQEFIQQRERSLEHLVEQKRAQQDLKALSLSDENEEVELENLVTQMKSYDHLARNLEHIVRIFEEESLPSSHSLRVLSQELQGLCPQTESWAQRLESVFFELEDLRESYKRELSALEYDEKRLEKAEERLFLINRAKKKYFKTSIQELLSYQKELDSSLQDLQESDTFKEELEKTLEEQQKNLLDLANKLSLERQKVAEDLTEAVARILVELDMKGVRFEARIEKARKISSSGFDKVNFFLHSAGLTRPLGEIASGGEIARIMLALRSLVLDQRGACSVLFDEIDAGIGGQVGLALGRHLRNLASVRQVFVVTHLATVAAFADWHLRLQKQEGQDGVFSSEISVLQNKEDRVAELARMLSGHQKSPQAQAHALDLLEKIHQEGISNEKRSSS